ncbi:hypothetical protein AJ80_04731 [Polytolypa hystricis UAMH7299]|uniref:Uncharacterized protein n=1 Tax=Polytolypa hystricis (strain UAMH7299) TaxID=1447883 RepID=A0A2B7Y9K8_POLH7|nr:hypothetical protein AJ80_04731 [Polytolypa hystricis UAMH7299]
MEASWNESRSSATPPAAPTYPCPQCHRSFKRSEHLKRHQRSHGNFRNFVCSKCPKRFARSDILRRHEATHTAIAQDSMSPARKRACMECARARERCSRGEPCLRCSTKSLSCLYPQEQHVEHAVDTSIRAVTEHTPQYTSPKSGGTTTDAFILHHPNEPAEQTPSPSQYQTSPMNNALAISQPCRTTTSLGRPQNSPQSFMQIDTCDQLGHQNGGYNQTTMDFPLNWLPANESVIIDYNSILGLGVDSLGLFSPLSESMAHGIPFESSSQGFNSTLPNLQDAMQQDSRIGHAQQLYPRLQTGRLPSSPIIRQAIPFDSASPGGSTGTAISSISRGSVEPTSPMSQKGGLYATSSDGARIPCTVRSRRPYLLIPGTTRLASIIDQRYQDMDGEEVVLGFPDLSQVVIHHTPEDFSSRTVESKIYQSIKLQFERLCITESPIFSRYSSTPFPSLHHFNLFTRLYFENFDPILPILHDQVASINDYWPLALAVCAIGCQYTETEEFSQCVEPLHEVLRRVLAVEAEKLAQDRHAVIPFAQSMVLSQIGMLYSGSRRLRLLARTRHSILLDIVDPKTFLRPSKGAVASTHCSSSQDSSWKTMLADAAKRKIGYSVWMLDCMNAYHFAENPCLTLDITQYPLPNDRVWSTKSCEEWVSLSKPSCESPSLSEAVQAIFRDKKVSPDLGEFSRIILLHGVYQEISQVKRWLSRPLAAWVPSIQPLQDHDDDNNASNQLAQEYNARSLLSSWRNASLDCIDVLHWEANGTIARLAGAEHPTVFHLHFSRVVLLVPHEQIRILASSIASLAQDRRLQPMPLASRQETIDAEREVLEWAQQDEHKARLAVLHCGCLIWHIRRYSRRAFYEPISVFLATLTIWAYSSYASRAPAPKQRVNPDNDNGDNCRSGSVTRHTSPVDSTTSPDSHTSSSSSNNNNNNNNNNNTAPSSIFDTTDPEPTFIRLDRPNDDEMVQLFVRSGRPSSMRAYITGVGNIYAPQGPMRMLREGRKILAMVSTAWGRTQEYAEMLEALDKVASTKCGP